MSKTLQLSLLAVFATGMTTFGGDIVSVVETPAGDPDVFIRIAGANYQAIGDELHRLPDQVFAAEVTPGVVLAGNATAGFEQPGPGYAVNVPVVDVAAPAVDADAEKISLRFNDVMTILGANDLQATGAQRDTGEDVFDLVNIGEDETSTLIATGTLTELETQAAAKMNTPVDDTDGPTDEQIAADLAATEPTSPVVEEGEAKEPVPTSAVETVSTPSTEAETSLASVASPETELVAQDAPVEPVATPDEEKASV